MRLPLAIEDIDVAAINAMLRASGADFSAVGVSLGEVMHGTATKVRLSIDWDKAGVARGLPQSTVLKGGFGPHRAQMAHIYAIEEHYYRTIQAQLGVPSPRCLATARVIEPGAEQALVLLEDLDAAGAHFCRVANPYTPVQASLFLDVLARMHAATWGSAKLAQTAPGNFPRGRRCLAIRAGPMRAAS